LPPGLRKIRRLRDVYEVATFVRNGWQSSPEYAEYRRSQEIDDLDENIVFEPVFDESEEGEIA
jgi:hypothetical protein